MFINVICNTKKWILLIKVKNKITYFMKKDTKDFKFCIKIAIENAKKRINLLEKMDQKCILEEYKEWIKDDLDYQSILLLREDPII